MKKSFGGDFHKEKMEIEMVYGWINLNNILTSLEFKICEEWKYIKTITKGIERVIVVKVSKDLLFQMG